MLYIWACSSVGRAFGSHPRGREFESLQVHQKCARRTQEPVIYVAGNLFVLVCPLAYAMDK